MMDIEDEVEEDGELLDIDDFGEATPANDKELQEKMNRKKERILIEPASLNRLKEEAIKNQYPLIEEYDFNRDTKNADLKIELKPNTMVRDYQETALSKMLGNGRARSGIIVLPCGAGKTLTGIAASCTIKKSTLVACTSQVSAEQWKREFLKWSHINPNDIMIFTSKSSQSKAGQKQLEFLYKMNKEERSQKTMVLICTYYMLSYSRKRENQAQKVMEFIKEHEWGLMLLDEVQRVPAKNFS